MRPIIIGAGRGSRLKALTDEQPKCYAPIGGRRILDWMLEALAEAGLTCNVELPDPTVHGGRRGAHAAHFSESKRRDIFLTSPNRATD